MRLDPGLAFGTGTHPTTALCLEWLERSELREKRIIDYGCGSGILAIAALKLGANEVIAVDNDPQALEATQSNAERNNVASKLKLHLTESGIQQDTDILIANILAAPLLKLAPIFASNLRGGGKIAISGILQGQEPELLDCYQFWFDELSTHVKDGWILIEGIRRDF